MSASSWAVAPPHTAVFYCGAGDLGSALEVLRPSLGRPREPIVLFGPSGVPATTRVAFDEHFDKELRNGAAATDVHLVEAHRDPDEFVARLDRAIERLTRNGADLVRVLGLVGWEAPGWPLPEDNMWAEARLNEALIGRRAEINCAYDVTSLPGPALIYGGLETHPRIIIGGALIKNDQVITPRSFIKDRLPRLPWLSPRASAVAPERGIHACAFFTTRDEEYATLLPLIKEGLAGGQSAIHIVDPERRQDHAARLEGAGITGGPEALSIREWSETTLVEGRFSADRMRATLRDLLSGSSTGTHLVADMAWALQQAPGVEELVEYEARINDSGPARLNTVICTYDSARFSGPTLIDILRAHPAVILGGVLQENDLHVPSETLLREIRQRTRTAAEPPQAGGGLGGQALL